jgi:hypothetical protein
MEQNMSLDRKLQNSFDKVKKDIDAIREHVNKNNSIIGMVIILMAASILIIGFL